MRRNPVSARSGESEVARRGVTPVLPAHDRDAVAVVGQELRCAVGGAVVHDDRFRRWDGLLEDALQALGEEAGAVVGGDDD